MFCMLAIPIIIKHHIAGVIISALLILLVFISGLLLNKHKYFKSEAWLILKNQYTQKIKIIMALNKSIKLIQREHCFDITLHCSLKVLDNAKMDPFKTICDSFDIRIDNKAIKWLNNMEKDLKIAEKERLYIEKERKNVINKIRKHLPIWIRIVSWDLEKYLGINNIVRAIKYPCYRFSYYSVSGSFYQTHTIVLNRKTINEFKKYINKHNGD